MNYKFLILAATLIAATPQAFAGILGVPAFGGSGCSGGSASLEQIGRGKYKINYPQMQMREGSLSRLNCSLRLPLAPPAGHQLYVKGLKLSVRHNVSDLHRVSVTESTRMVGQINSVGHTYPLSGNGVLQINPAGSPPSEWAVTSCGRDGLLALDVTFNLVPNNPADTNVALSELNVADAEFTLYIRPCNP